MLIGATMTAEDLPTYRTMLAGNDIMRIFPSTVTVAGKSTKVLPAWTDSRFTYCRDAGAVPFVSTKVDGDPDAIAYVRKQLLALPDWIAQLYITDRHEPEGDVTPEAFKTNFTLFLAMIDGLPPALRARIRCGPVLTKTWTERAGAGRTYDTYDPGTGDFFGVDMYVESGTAKTVVSPATLPTAQQFTAAFKAYRKNGQDRRDRLWPELGVVGMPGDPDGTARAAFIRAVHAEVASWGPAELGWTFVAMIWWNATGKATGEVAQIGQRRDFPLHLRTVSATTAGFSALSSPIAVTLPGDPPAPVAAFNEIWTAEHTPAQPPVTQPPAGTAAPAGTYEDGWRAGRLDLLAALTSLVQDTATTGPKAGP